MLRYVFTLKPVAADKAIIRVKSSKNFNFMNKKKK